MTPCLIPEAEGLIPFALDTVTYSLLDISFALFGIESLFGPTWDNIVRNVCFFSADLCDQLSGLELYDTTTREGFQEGGVKVVTHLA